MKDKKPKAYTAPEKDVNNLFTQSSPAGSKDSKLTRIKGAGKALLGGTGLGLFAGACIITGGIAFLPLVIAAIAVSEIVNKPTRLLYDGIKEVLTGKKAEVPTREFASKSKTITLGTGKIGLGVASIGAAALLTIGTGGWFLAPIVIAGLINPDIIKKPFKLIYSGCKDIISASKKNSTPLPNQQEAPIRPNTQQHREHHHTLNTDRGINVVSSNNNSLPRHSKRGNIERM
ncbi:MAG: hypothetical protein AB8U25_01065 [Rickettsiales endosymbiont of Dermacentor nuttalli]